MSTSFQEFKAFCNKVGLDFQWLNLQSSKSVPENGSSEGFSTVSDAVQENIRPATEPLNVNQSKDPVSNFFMMSRMLRSGTCIRGIIPVILLLRLVLE
ncbi:BPK_HP2_G0044500.mRNA.1.CDS.1 [Saccharomyces cerevisiae]|nr:BMC_2a_G0046790.mRNA.1.CDS.1 [Saccharomyces cerevisiae]CAI4721700.1 CFS_G0046770.mRNA.1.CDS.1 [Saccharomyces cerevisiae]CAI4755872.1 AKH_1a_G0045550.mRNA.1.CDS.1 [Saccharomyces cerevisiae]CAI4760411.1 AEH_G0046850.mRNA.1.CDS.1 [Saccharomyces cerevisiae]CAI4982842.1 BAD_HP_G0052550.mRNA.1.CDS.1 [Saccharomyces cerevisiae]